MKKRDQSHQYFVIILGILVILIAAIILLTAYMKNQKSEEAVSEMPEEEVTEVITSPYYTINMEISSADGITIEHNHVSWDTIHRPGEVREIRYIIIHETDNRGAGADADAHGSYLTTDFNDSTAWHYTVDDHSIVHHIPDNEIAWNAGDGRTEDGGNMNGIGVEMCVNVSGDYEQTLKNTAGLAAELLVTYNLVPEDVRFHEDFMDKVCPHRLITEGRTEEFRQMIKDAYRKRMKEEE